MQEKTQKVDIRAMTRIALCVALLSASAYITIPIPFSPIPLSLQTLMVTLIALILIPKHAAYTILLYLVMGLVGLPVYSGGGAGPSRLFGPWGGFLFGFLAAVLVIGFLKGKKPNLFRYSLVTVLAGIPAMHLFAMLFFCFYNGFALKDAFLTVSLPFIPGDVLKCVIASVLGVGLHRILDREIGE